MEMWLSAAFCDADEYVELARAAERLGYDTIAISDHFFHADYGASYPYSETGAPPYDAGTHWPDVWVTIGAMGAVTRRLNLATNVYIAPARDLFTVAKAVSTAAVLSGNRVRLGIGAGWCEDEFRQTGQDFRTRGRRLDEMIPVLHELWKGGPVEYHGQAYDFGPLSISPVPSAPVPVYVGGDSDAALRRTARLGDGWVGNRIYTEEQLEELMARMSRHLAEHGRGFDDVRVIAPIGAMPSVDLYRKWADRGVTGTIAAPWWPGNPPLATKIAAMERFGEEIISNL